MKNSAEKVFIGTMILIFTIIGGIGYPLYNLKLERSIALLKPIIWKMPMNKKREAYIT